VSSLPSPPAQQQWIAFTAEPVAFLVPSSFTTHREDNDTVAVYPPGDSGITLRFSLNTQAIHAKTPAGSSEQFLSEYAAARGLHLTHLRDRVCMTETREEDWPDRRVLMHYWQIGLGRLLIVASATIWGPDRKSSTIEETLGIVPGIIESFRVMKDT
jgi:hypothetical protein